jgi:hypothetical protein
MKLSYRSITTLLGRGATTKFRVKTPKGDVELSIKEQFTGPPGGANIDTTGRLVWPTAVPLLERIKAEYLNEKSSILPSMPMPILEIGAGCGVLGTGLASTGFFDVTLTDTDQSVDWLENNVELNRNLVGDNAKVASLNWGDEGDAAKLEATLKAPFELIVGSDILYDHTSHASLVATIKRFALPGNATAILAYPTRQDEDAFLSVAREHFDVKVEAMEPCASMSSSSGQYSISFLSLKRKKCLS